MKAVSGDRSRLEHIDCLRALAALFVMCHHIFGEAIRLSGTTGPISDAVTHILYAYIDLGRTGVLLFFIISGYCIAHSILRPSPSPATAFVINRLARIYPAYWLSILAAVAVYGLPSSPDLIANITLTQGFLGRPHMIGVYWTLTIELSFYALCVGLYLLGILSDLRRIQFIWLALVTYCVFAAVMRSATGLALPYAWPWFLSLMVGGTILRRRDDSNLVDRRLMSFSVLGLLASALIIAVCIYHDPDTYNKGWLRDFISNATAILLFVVGNYAIRIRSSVLAYLGTISYSLYLFHPLILEVGSRILSETIAGQGALGAIFFIIFLMMPIFAICSVSYHIVELSGIAMGRKMIELLQKQAAAFSIRLP
jgi:peptidoglycan/LPS O-acetylase OafA/YrhL